MKSANSIVSHFQQQVTAYPHLPAINFDNEVLSYKQLDEKSDAMAVRLASYHFTAGSNILVYMKKSKDVVIAMLAIFKSGLTYVPLDPELPAERLEYIITDCAGACVLTNLDTPKKMGSSTIPVICINNETFIEKAQIKHHEVAYIIYTSGSTGKPKGTIVTHKGLFASTKQRIDYYGAAGNILLVPSFAFDASLAAVLWSLLSGGCLIILPDEQLKSSVTLRSCLHKLKIDSLLCVPSYYRFLLEGEVLGESKPKVVILGGESWDESLADDHFAKLPETSLYNEYGPTECTIWATVSRVEKQQPINIGHSLPGVILELLDEKCQQVNAGEEGEIFLGGTQLALGYLNLPEATNKAFITLNGQRLYRTGDMARYNANRTLVYLGRKDDQVKISGHRVELGEIEKNLAGISGVAQSIVLSVGEERNYLVAFYVAKSGVTISGHLINGFLRKQLPAYMIPQRLIQLPALPLTSNGKIDKAQLMTHLSPRQDLEVKKPLTELERNILVCWQRLFKLEKISTEDHFTSIGGDSLLAMRMVSYLEREFQYRIAISDVFTIGTISGLAKKIQSGTTIARIPLTPAKAQPAVAPLSFQQEQMWVIDQLDGSPHYHIEINYLITGELDVNALKNAIQSLIIRHPVLHTVIKSQDDDRFQTYTNPSISLEITDDPAYLNTFLRSPVDLSCDLPVRVVLYSSTDTVNELYIVVHHIAADGWTLCLLMEDLLELYAGNHSGQTQPNKRSQATYFDYAAWQRELVSHSSWETGLTYWKNKLSGSTPTGFPLDRRHPASPTREGASITFGIQPIAVEQIRNLCKAENMTLYVYLLTIVKLLICKYNNELEDVAVGSMLGNRTDPQLDHLAGYFANTVVMRSVFLDNMSIREAFNVVRETVQQAMAFGDVPFERVVEELHIPRTNSGNTLFSVMLVLQDKTLPAAFSFGDCKWTLQKEKRKTSKFDLLWDISESAAGLEITLEYNTDIFDFGTIDAIRRHFEQLSNEVLKLDLALPFFEVGLTVEDPAGTVDEMKVTYPRHLNLVDIFRTTAHAHADRPAIVVNGVSLSYAELDMLSNQLGHYLQGRGIGPGSLVPLCTERSFGMIIGILGILKAGGAYVPIDPLYPQERIRFMLEDTGSPLVLTGSAVKIETPLERVILEEGAWHDYPDTEVSCDSTPEDLAYVIYTSGSTGRPKGVMIEHRNVVRLFFNSKTLFDFSPDDTWCLFHSFCFDFSVWEMYGALLFGGKLVIVPRHALNAIDFLRLLYEEKVTVLNQTPTAFYALQEQVMQHPVQLKVRQVIFGGEALNPCKLAWWKKEFPDCQLINMYGITETTVHVTYKEIGDKEISAGISNIGKPIPTLDCIVLDRQQRKVPVGIPGELYVSGDGVSRGYLHNPDLTASRFIMSPFVLGDRLYRTGDLARWQIDGTLEYLGRIDDQVKIRGYRIELGEIENVILRSGMVSQSVVIAREGKLLGYVVSSSFNKPALLAYLHSQLPEYMVPSLLVSLDSIPMTTNGKVDRKALPEATGLLERGYEAAQTETEAVLSEIWQELLGLERVGVQDNFFEIGGDSIVSIQVVSRARKRGLYLQPRDIFRSQTVRLLAATLTATYEIHAEQGNLSGRSGLLPVQQWFFAQGHNELSHYNQSLLLGISKAFDTKHLQSVVNVLLRQHDALRFRYVRLAEGWEQWYGESAVEVEEAVLTDDDLPSVCSIYQRQLNITEGPLLRVVLLRSPGNSHQNLLLITVHHLCVDGVSWRIISEDIHNCLDALSQGKELNLGAKSSAYRQWYQALERYASSTSASSQYPYWSAIMKGYRPLPVDHIHTGPRRIRTMNRKEVRLSTALTRLLLQESHFTYHTDAKDLLLSALVLVLQHWTGRGQHLIGLEGHGRSDLGAELDLNRTVGWFTTLYPVLLDLGDAEVSDYGRVICTLKEQLRGVPDHGLGYGALRYLHPDEATRRQMSLIDNADIVFNYLGQLGNLVNNSAWLSQPADIVQSAGELSGADNIYSFRLGVDSYIYEERLTVIWSYSREEYEDRTIEELSGQYIQYLESLITHCTVNRQKGFYTPSDYGLTGKLKESELELLNTKLGRAGLQELYGLSSLQEGMLFHGLYDNNSGTYIEQFSCVLEDVDPQRLKLSWEQVLSDYSILRTSFQYKDISVPVQRVHTRIVLPFIERDLRGLEDDVRDAAIAAFLVADRLQGFDFTVPPLMRVHLLRLNDTRYRMVWTFHHILLDGWSIPIVISRLQSVYRDLEPGRTVQYLQTDHYGDFIHYLQLRNKYSEAAYWQSYLSGFDTPSLLPFTAGSEHRNHGTDAIGTELLKLDADFTGRLQQYSQQHRLTVSTVMQGVWSYLLAQYTGQEDVLFGVTVSGRPTELENADRRVGLYIHTILQRSILPVSGVFREWLLTLQQAHTLSREYPYIPLTNIQDLLGIKGELFDSLLVFENYPAGKDDADAGLSLADIQLAEHTNYLLTIVVEPGTSTQLSFSYNSELLAADRVAMIACHFRTVLEQIVSNAELLIESVKLVNAAEAAKLYSFRGEELAFPAQTLTSLFKESARVHADLTAVVMDGVSLSYAELDMLSNQLGHYLQGRGIGPGCLVPLCTERSFGMIIGILGILKAGGAYVPIDPLYPQERIRFMLEDTGSPLVLTGSAVKIETPLERVILEEGAWHDYPDTEVSCDSTPEDLAYVIYTSGSTGRPKGVMNEHRGVVNRLHWAGTYYGLGQHDVILQKTTFCFDVSVWELLLPLLYGSRLVFARPGGQRDSDYLKRLIEAEGITMIHFVPGMLEVFLPEVPAGECLSLRQVICSGEALKREQVMLFSQKLSHAALYNLYGPTEAAIDVTCWPVPLAPVPSQISIGKAIANVSLYVLNKNQGLQPLGVPGELYIGGVQVSRGYLHNPDLTASRFIMSPFVLGDRLYRTGDLARWQIDGTLEYLGRIDDQVKIRGYRIELGEIENVILRSGMVSQSVVIAREGKLLGYVVSSSFNKPALLAYLHSQLPEYMVPSLLVSLDSIPMTTNGKVDRKALPEATGLLERGYEAAQTETEAVLCEIWQELLGLERVGVQDNFFEIGGDSIRIIKLFQAMNKRFGLVLNVSDLFKYNSIKLQSGLMDSNAKPMIQVEV